MKRRKIKDSLKSSRWQRVRGAVTWKRHVLVSTALLMVLCHLSAVCPWCVGVNSPEQAGEGLDNLMSNDFLDLEWKHCTPNLSGAEGSE